MAKGKVLVFGGGEIHDWKGTQPHIVEALSGQDQLEITTAQEDLSVLEADSLTPYDALVFYYTIGEITDAQRDGLSHWIASGKGFVAIHGAGDSFRDDPDYRNLIGGYFTSHPRYRTYQVSVSDPDHPVTRGLDEEFMVDDEQYVLDYDPRVHVLATALWKGDVMPVAWSKSHGDGRVVYIALGHDPMACQHTMFQALVRNGTLWAAGREA